MPKAFQFPQPKYEEGQHVQSNHGEKGVIVALTYTTSLSDSNTYSLGFNYHIEFYSPYKVADILHEDDVKPILLGDRSRQKPQQPAQEQIISDWLSLAGEKEKITVLQRSDTSITVRCGDSMQAGELWYNLPMLAPTGIKFATIYIGKSFFNSLSFDQIPKGDRRTFIQTLLQTHREILEAGSIAIDDVVRIYCATKEEAIALHDGRWDLCERAQEQQLPQQFELYYSGDDKKHHLYKTFSTREGLLVKELQRREIAALFQKLDIADNP
jgi:hypothetical protein